MGADPDRAPLSGMKVVEVSRTVAGAFAGRLLATLGSETVMVEPSGGNPLRAEPPFLPGDKPIGALFAYLAAGKDSVIADLLTVEGRSALTRLLVGADALIVDAPLSDREALGLDEGAFSRDHPDLVYVSVLPFGAAGPKSGWRGEEINLIHAAGEGFLLPNGLSVELFPDRPPLKIHGYFAEMQGGIVAALGALSALWCREKVGGQSVDVSVQDAALAVGAFAIQRLGDGSLEHRSGRSFKYGGVLECADGYVELLTLEERQWEGLIALMDNPDWARDPVLRDPLERSRRGAEIQLAIRSWARAKRTADLVEKAQTLGVPMAKYNSPMDVVSGPHELARGLFQEVDIPDFGPCATLVAPFQFSGAPLHLASGPPRLGADRSRPRSGPPAHSAVESMDVP
jgi:crotonobetainyl-CoA:carnitine CoA-transferase CaiB-like acyl-CoA transferase